MNSLSPKTYQDALERARKRPVKPRAQLARKSRAKLMTRKRAIKVLDELTSKIVRLIGGACVQCDSTEKLTCGHVLSRRSHATRWSFDNCFVQCWPCNFAHGSRSPVPYFRWYVRTFGQETFDALYTKWSKGQKFSTPDLRTMVQEYTVKLKELSG